MTGLLVILIGGMARGLVIVSRLLGKNGTSLPGLLIEKRFSWLLSRICRDLDQVILISGTNGKTTTRALLGHIYEHNQIKICTNRGGANIMRGIAATLLLNLDILNRPKAKIAILEVEEATLPILTRYVKCDKLILTNIFRDQLDAYGSIDQTLDYFTQSIKQGSQMNPEMNLIVNGDDTKLIECIPESFSKNKIIAFKAQGEGFNHTKFESLITNSENIKNQFVAKNIQEGWKGVKFDLESQVQGQSVLGSTVKIESNLPGFYNVYNLLTVLACCYYDFGEKSKQAILSFVPVFGRGEIISIKNSECVLYLVKNPAGFNEILRLLPEYIKDKQRVNIKLCFVINDNTADGKDISWLWDTDFERYFEKVEEVKTNKIEFRTLGTRGLDMLLRLQIAGQDVTEKDYIEDTKNLIEEFRNEPGAYFVFANYTGLMELRSHLEKEVELKKINGVGN